MGGIVNAIFGGGGGGGASAPAAPPLSQYDPFATVGTGTSTGGTSGRQYAANQLYNIIQDPSAVLGMPGYQQTKQEGVNTAQAAAAASGTLQSGGQSAALQGYGQNIFNQYYNQLYNQYGTLSGATTQTPTQATQSQYGQQLQQTALQNQINQQNTQTGIFSTLLAGSALSKSGIFGGGSSPAGYDPLMSGGDLSTSLSGAGEADSMAWIDYAASLSDIRAKENIELIGQLPSGLNVYNFEYKPEFKDVAGHGKFTGVMAQEVEQIIPEAVITLSNGYKAVKYSLIH